MLRRSRHGRHSTSKYADAVSERGKAFLTAEGGATTVYQAFYLEWMAFLDGVRTGQASEFSARSALATVGAVEALYSGQSA